MAKLKNSLPVADVFSLFIGSLLAAEYMVGDNEGWNANVDHYTWVEGKSFNIRDVLGKLSREPIPHTIFYLSFDKRDHGPTPYYFLQCLNLLSKPKYSTDAYVCRQFRTFKFFIGLSLMSEYRIQTTNDLISFLTSSRVLFSSYVGDSFQLHRPQCGDGWWGQVQPVQCRIKLRVCDSGYDTFTLTSSGCICFICQYNCNFSEQKLIVNILPSSLWALISFRYW